MDLAKAIAPECQTKVIGIRPGEKLHELMIPRDEAHMTLEFDKFFVVQPAFRFWERRSSWNGGQTVEDGFEYRSDNNPWRLTVDEMGTLIERL